MINAEAARAWASTHGLRILFIVLVVLVTRQVLSRVIPAAIHRAILRDGADRDPAELLKRADTLTIVILRGSAAAVLIVAAFFILSEVGFNIAPVLAGLGIGGLALGLGAQTLVKDTINGIFILGENHFGRGDTVTLAGVDGRVEDVNLRRTVLRADDGTVYTIPNSAIVVASNHTRGYSGIYFTVNIAYLADLERAIQEINRLGQDMARDGEYKALVLDPPRVLRVEAMEDTYLTLRIGGRVQPGAHVRVSGELRRRIKEEFDRLGIPYRGSPLVTGEKHEEGTGEKQ